MTDLTELIERVRNASGPDREIDLDIAIVCGIVDPEVAKYGPYLRRAERRRVDPFTSSIEAITALIEKRLPGWHISSTTVGEHNIPQACLTDPDGDCRDFLAHHITEALARVEAFLLAIQENSRDQ